MTVVESENNEMFPNLRGTQVPRKEKSQEKKAREAETIE